MSVGGVKNWKRRYQTMKTIRETLQVILTEMGTMKLDDSRDDDGDCSSMEHVLSSTVFDGIRRESPDIL